MEYLLKILRSLQYDTLLDRTPILYLRGSDLAIFQTAFQSSEGFNFTTADLGVLLVAE